MSDHILITGGAGFIGSHLAERLLKAGYRVTSIDDLSTGLQSNLDLLQVYPEFRSVIGDIRDEVTLDRLTSEADAVIHLAAAVGVALVVERPLATLQINIQGTESVLKAARRYNRRVLLASTSEVYGKNTKLPFSEDDDRTLGPTTIARWGYAASKELDEFLAMAYYYEAKLPITIFRLFNTVGPRQQGRYGMVLPRFVEWALRGEPIQVYGDGLQSRCFCNVSDATAAIHALKQSPASIGKVFNIGNDESVTILELAERVKGIADSASPIILTPYGDVFASGFEDMRARQPDLRKIAALTGWKPALSLDETIRQVIDSLR